MTLTNTATILRQIGAIGGAGGYMSDDAEAKKLDAKPTMPVWKWQQV